ncbi:sigma factor [Micromonospora sp. M12]
MRDSRGAEFDDFVRTRSVVLLRVAFLLSGDRHAAEDLLQDVLEQVYVRWRRVQSSPEAYARRALVNRSINRWRWRSRRPEQALGHHDGVAGTTPRSWRFARWSSGRCGHCRHGSGPLSCSATWRTCRSPTWRRPWAAPRAR